MMFCFLAAYLLSNFDLIWSWQCTKVTLQLKKSRLSQFVLPQLATISTDGCKYASLITERFPNKRDKTAQFKLHVV